MKKIILYLCAAVFVLSISACGSSEKVSQEEYDAVVAELEELKKGQEVEDGYAEDESNVNKAADDEETKAESNTQNDNGVEIVAEYTLADSINWYTRHFMVIKNNSSETVDVSSSSIAYDAAGNVLGAEDASLYALGAGCTSVMYEAFEIDGDVDKYDTSITSSSSGYYKSVIQDLTYTQSDISNGAVFQVTNNGSDAAEFVKGYALFIKDGNLVAFDDKYFTDDDYEIKPGVTITKQFDTTKEFDNIQFYLEGRK